MKVVQINDLTKVQEKLRNHPPRTMYFVHYTRDDIVMAFLEEYERRKCFGKTFESALMICSPNINDVSSRIRDIIAGQQSASITNNKVNIPPIMVLPCLARDAISMINKYTPKLNADDSNRVSKAIEHYEPFIDFDRLLERTKVVLDLEKSFQRRSESLW
jgi:ribosomal protein S17E